MQSRSFRQGLTLGMFAAPPALVILLYLWSCDETSKPRTPAKPGPDEVVIKIGTYSITDRELNRFVDYCQKMDPQLALPFIRRTTLSDQLVPYLVARSLADRDEIRLQERKAEDLARAVADRGGDISELRRLGTPFGGEEQDGYLEPFNDLKLDVAEIAFSLPVGQVSGAIHSDQGSLVLAAVDEKTKIGVVDAMRVRKFYTVFFPYSSDPEFAKAVKERVKSLLASTPKIHSMYRDTFAPLFPTNDPLPKKDQHP